MKLLTQMETLVRIFMMITLSIVADTITMNFKLISLVVLAVGAILKFINRLNP